MRLSRFFYPAFVFAAALGAAACTSDVDVVNPDTEAPTTPVAVAQNKAGVLDVDDTWLYIGAGDAPVPFRVVKTGGAPELIAPTDNVKGSGVALLAIDATDVYWTTFVGEGDSQYGLWRAPKAGGAASLLYSTVGPNNSSPAAMAIDDSFVYLTYPDIYNANNGPENLVGLVRRVPKAGGASDDIASVFSYTVAVDQDHVYWARPTLDGAGEVVRANKDGSNPQVLASELGPVGAVAVAGDRVFWTYGDAGVFGLRSATSGGQPEALGVTEAFIGTPAVAPEAAYWVRGGGAGVGGVVRAEVGGAVEVIAQAPASASAPVFYGTYGRRIAVDSDAVYWSYEGAQGGAQRVYRVAR